VTEVGKQSIYKVFEDHPNLENMGICCVCDLIISF